METQRFITFFREIKNIVDDEINLLDVSGTIIESTCQQKIGSHDGNAPSLKENFSSIMELNDYQYLKINTLFDTFFLSIKGSSHESEKLLKLMEVFFKDNKDVSKEDFVKGVLLNTFDESTMYRLCEKFQIHPQNRTQIYVVQIAEQLIGDAEDIFKAVFPHELFVKVNQQSFAFIQEVSDLNDDLETLLSDVLLSELLFVPKIGQGLIVNHISEWNKSYRTADQFINLGKLFLPEKNNYSYKDLILPLLIQNIEPHALTDIAVHLGCGIKELFSNHELMTTASAFLKNNLSISDTAKLLYIHRNTLIYRLNKIQSITGYDLRIFEEALMFNLAAVANRIILYHEKDIDADPNKNNVV